MVMKGFDTTNIVECAACGGYYAVGAKECPLCTRTEHGHDTQTRPRAQAVTTKPHKAKTQSLVERELQNQCEALLRRNGVEFLHLSFRAREKVGWPDLVFVLPSPIPQRAGTPYAIELKSATGELTDDQARVLERMERNGWSVAIVRSYDEFAAIVRKQHDNT